MSFIILYKFLDVNDGDEGFSSMEFVCRLSSEYELSHFGVNNNKLNQPGQGISFNESLPWFSSLNPFIMAGFISFNQAIPGILESLSIKS